MKICYNCEHESAENEKFCSQCGHKLNRVDTNNSTHKNDKKEVGMKGHQECFQAEVIESIHVSCKLYRVHVIGNNGDSICFRWNNSKVRTLDVIKSGNALQISDRGIVALYGPLGLYELKKENLLTVEIPKSYNGSISIESANEAIDMTNVLFAGTIYARSTTNVLNLSSVKATVIDVQSTSGMVNCKNIDADNYIDISSTSGRIECGIADNAANYLIDCYSQYGACSVPHAHGGGPKKLQVHSANGSVAVWFDHE